MVFCDNTGGNKMDTGIGRASVNNQFMFQCGYGAITEYTSYLS